VYYGNLCELEYTLLFNYISPITKLFNPHNTKKESFNQKIVKK